MRRAVLIAFAMLAGCAEKLTPEEQALQDERDVAMVERANAAAPPVEAVTPDPIQYADIERNDLFGMACTYAPGTSLGMRVIAREVDAYIKLDGKMLRFAADAGSRELPGKTRSLYTGKEYALQLDLRGEGRQTGDEVIEYEGTVVLRDRFGREVYQGTGLAECGA